MATRLRPSQGGKMWGPVGPSAEVQAKMRAQGLSQYAKKGKPVYMRGDLSTLVGFGAEPSPTEAPPSYSPVESWVLQDLRGVPDSGWRTYDRVVSRSLYDCVSVLKALARLLVAQKIERDSTLRMVRLKK